MILNEEMESTINDASMSDSLRAGAYGEDNRPCWIGAYRPATTCPDLKGLAGWAAAHYAYYENFVREYVDKRGKILDVGCGCGQNTAMLARYGEAIGVDPESFGICFAKKHNSISGATFLRVEFPSPEIDALRPFDYIFCIETMEHVEYEKQLAFMASALGLLGPDGMMFITTPDESEPSGPHHGIWSPAWREKVRERFGQRIVRWGRFDNQKPREGFVTGGGTHHALVLK